MDSNGHELNGKAVGRLGAGDDLGFDKSTRDTIGAMLGIGCDLRTAAWAVGRSPAEVKRLLAEDPELLHAVQKGGAIFEYKHLQHLDEAAKDKKNYRVSMWLLERLRPDTYEKQRPRTIKENQLMPLLKSLADALVEGVGDEEARGKLIERVKETAEDLDPMGALGEFDGF